jgi:hypothetical protein
VHRVAVLRPDDADLVLDRHAEVAQRLAELDLRVGLLGDLAGHRVQRPSELT